MICDSFISQGFALTANVLSEKECGSIHAYTNAFSLSAGTRNLLSQPWCIAIAKQLRANQSLRKYIPQPHVAVQCTYFEKSVLNNWLVSLHQDLSIPVANRIEHVNLSGWSKKEGAHYVQAPIEVLQQLVAIRLHLDACMDGDGPLRVVPGSHTHGILSPEAATRIRHTAGEQICSANQGSALAMSPLLLHASSKSVGNSRRRVLHFLYAPRTLPYGLNWSTKI